MSWTARRAFTTSKADQARSTMPGRPVLSGETTGTAIRMPSSRPVPSSAPSAGRPCAVPMPWPAACSAMMRDIPHPAQKNIAAPMTAASRTPSMCRISPLPPADKARPKDWLPGTTATLRAQPRGSPAGQHAQLIHRFQDGVRPVGVPLHQPEFYPASAGRIPVAGRPPPAEVLVHSAEERRAGAARHQAAGAQDGRVVPDGPLEQRRADRLGDRRSGPLGEGRQEVEDELVGGEDVKVLVACGDHEGPAPGPAVAIAD